MSNIFITDIVGTGTYAVPTDDTELAAATSGLDTLLSGVSNLSYDRVLAWVEDSGGPDGAEGTRTLNCLVEKFTYLTNECPSETQVDTMIAAIESALEADANITSVGNQQVHIFQTGAYFLWNRDASGGFLYPNTATDDVAVGPFATPTGKWFDDGDLVLGAAAMSGTEKLRVVGSARIDTNGQLLIADSATIPPLNLTERSAAPSSPSAGDIYVDDGTNTGSGSPGFRRYTGAVWEDMGATGGGGGGAPISSVLLGSTYTYTQASSPVEEVTGNGAFNGGIVGALTAYFKAAVTNTWASTGIGETTRIRLYDIGPAAGPPDPTERLVSELTFTAQGGPRSAEVALTVVAAAPSTDDILNSSRMYEVVVIQDASTTGDVGYLGSAVIEVR